MGDTVGNPTQGESAGIAHAVITDHQEVRPQIGRGGHDRGRDRSDAMLGLSGLDTERRGPGDCGSQYLRPAAVARPSLT